MRLSNWAAVIFLLQGAAIFFDEFYFHHRRGLPRWERLGHPLDTLSVLVCYSLVLFLEPTTANIYIFGALAIFSCVFITKDEFVHQEKCSGGETWLHSVLFILHPLSLILAGLIWVGEFASPGINQFLMSVFRGQFALITAFLFYQIIYWSFVSTPQAE